jgi:hypothetical protein
MQPKPDRGSCPAPLFDGDVAKLGPLNPAELAARHAHGVSGRVLTGSGVVASQPDLAGYLVVDAPELIERPVESAISSSHAGNAAPVRSSVD